MPVPPSEGRHLVGGVLAALLFLHFLEWDPTFQARGQGGSAGRVCALVGSECAFAWTGACVRTCPATHQPCKASGWVSGTCVRGFGCVRTCVRARIRACVRARRPPPPPTRHPPPNSRGRTSFTFVAPSCSTAPLGTAGTCCEYVHGSGVWRAGKGGGARAWAAPAAARPTHPPVRPPKPPAHGPRAPPPPPPPPPRARAGGGARAWCWADLCCRRHWRCRSCLSPRGWGGCCQVGGLCVCACRRGGGWVRAWVGGLACLCVGGWGAPATLRVAPSKPRRPCNCVQGRRW